MTVEVSRALAHVAATTPRIILILILITKSCSGGLPSSVRPSIVALLRRTGAICEGWMAVEVARVLAHDTATPRIFLFVLLILILLLNTKVL